MRILRILWGEFCDENVKFMAAMGRPDIRHPFGCNSVALHADMMVLFVFFFFWVQNNTGNLGAILPVPVYRWCSQLLCVTIFCRRVTVKPICRAFIPWDVWKKSQELLNR